MKRCPLTILPTVVLTLVGLLATSYRTQAESPGYQSPSFYGVSQAGGGQFRPASPYPASPLAGGSPAAQGGAFMDAHGRPIVMPTNYCQTGPGGAYCQGGAGYGDPMAVDFGGCATQDQCGPHYFDVAIESVFLQSDDLIGSTLQPFSSGGVGTAPPPPHTNNPFLDPAGEDDDLSPGWRIAVRYDIGPLSVFEATYMGLYDIGFNSSVNSVDQGLGTGQLFSIFSQYGIAPDPAGGPSGITGLDGADQHSLSYNTDLQSTELTYRRYWVGHSPRISGTFLAGANYVRFTEDLLFSAITQFGNGSVRYESENDLVGFQFGGDGWICLRQGLRLGTDGKLGIYNNRYKFRSDNNAVTTVINPQLPEEGNQLAFVAQGGVSFVADIFSSWSLKGGYQAIYMNNLIALRDNVATTQYYNGGANDLDTAVPAPALYTNGYAFFHGFNCGLEYVW